MQKKRDAVAQANAKAYLSRALEADSRLEALIERGMHYRDMALRTTSFMEGGVSGGRRANSRVEDGVAALLDLSELLEQEAGRYAALVSEIEAVIAKVPQERYQTLLRWRYLSGWHWERIAEALHHELRWVYELHGRALQEVDSLLTGAGGSAFSGGE